jgi:L-histidine N-alpha-methyltransferase
MSESARVTIHPSQFPGPVRRDLLESLRAREVNHKFHYDSIKQTNKWLALHEAYSPARTDSEGAAVYDLSFAEVARQITANAVQVIGLGCGGGQKDTRLLHLLKQAGKRLEYVPSDVSTAMVLVAREAALAVIAEDKCHPLVCDLATAEDLGEVIGAAAEPNAARVITFFGMIPNFEPQLILPRLARLVRPADYLLFSANLAPGRDYLAGIKKILPLYDNELTREWLLTFLLDLGVERSDGELRFSIEDDPHGSGLKRIAAYFHFTRATQLRVDGERFEFLPRAAIRLFFSYRHTPERIRELLGAHGLTVENQWVTTSEEEGVFLCRREKAI